jgi:hypothetical protein
MTLYRPVGLKELQLIVQLGFHAFPPRLEIQPIFYPVLNFEYAEQIAQEWNTKDPFSGYCGFVTKFEVDDDYAGKFPVQIVGGARLHQELWVPSEELDEFNAHMVGPIEVVASYYGKEFSGEVDKATQLPANLI